MKLNERNVKDMYATIEGAKKISRVPFEVDQFRNWCYTLNIINGLEYGKTMVDGYSVAEYLIPDFMKSMVVPSKINFVISDIAKDMKGKIYFEDGALKGGILSPLQFNLISSGILGARRSSATTTSVDNLRVASTLNDISERAYLAGSELAYNRVNAYCPIAISVELIQQTACTEDINDVFAKWFYELYTTLS